MRAYERLLKYVTVYTTSDSSSDTVPSSSRQFDLAHMLVEEMKLLGIADAAVDDKCYVYGHIPASAGCEKAPAIGLIAHMDTAPDFSGENVKPQIIENYDGSDVPLGDSGRVLSNALFPHLASFKGRTLICSDGTTLLGADDKAGIAEILTAVQEILEEKRPHGKICLAFTPDEEIGKGPHHFNLKKFNADYAYTVDGNDEGEVVYETFNAASAEITVNGFNVHPGSAKGLMINSQLVAMEINSMLPGTAVPSLTEGYEGFYHLGHMSGDVTQTKMHYIIRDHDSQMFEARKGMLLHIQKVINEKYGKGTVEIRIKDQYYNMRDMILPHFHLIENAKAAAEDAGMTPVVVPVRGGTDGAQLSFQGLPCPNLGTGGHAYHGPYEHITAEGMDLTVTLIIGILDRYARMKRKVTG